MTNNSILKNIARHIVLNQEETDYFLSLLAFKNVARKTTLLKEGQPCNYLNFVHAGALRAYHLDKEARQSTIMFALTDWWVTDMYCFLNDKPAMMYIEAIEDSSIYQLSKANMDKLFHDVPKFERFFRILTQNGFDMYQERITSALSLTAEERYAMFRKLYPTLETRIAQKHIASYIGITPVFLSKLRQRL